MIEEIVQEMFGVFCREGKSWLDWTAVSKPKSPEFSANCQEVQQVSQKIFKRESFFWLRIFGYRTDRSVREWVFSCVPCTQEWSQEWADWRSAIQKLFTKTEKSSSQSGTRQTIQGDSLLDLMMKGFFNYQKNRSWKSFFTEPDYGHTQIVARCELFARGIDWWYKKMGYEVNNREEEFGVPPVINLEGLDQDDWRIGKS